MKHPNKTTSALLWLTPPHHILSYPSGAFPGFNDAE